MSKPIHEVLGIKKAKSTKTGKDCFTYFLKSEFSDYEQENCECEGSSSFNEFSYTDYGVHVGDFVELDYVKGFQDKATLSDMRIVKSPWEEKQKASASASK